VRKVYLAGVVLGATLVAAAWLYSYQTWHTIEVFDQRGQVVASTRVSGQPWWSVYASLAVALVGIGVSAWLLPQGRVRFRRFVNRLGHGGLFAKLSY
jgi:ABC-type sulfate transport system permease component